MERTEQRTVNGNEIIERVNERFRNATDDTEKRVWGECWEIVATAPQLDAPVVTRCGGCRFAFTPYGDGVLFCGRFSIGGALESEDYCSRGEPKEE